MGSSLWFIICAMGALQLRVGMGLHLAGMLRSKNSAGGILRTVVDAGVATLAFWAVGAAIVGGHEGRWIAWNRLLGSFTGVDGPIFLFLLAMTLVCSGIVTGVVAERSKFFPMCCASALLGGIVAPVALGWQWGGWLERLGFHDFAGASAIHLTGAACGAVVAALVGPRMNKYNRDGSSNAIPGHSVPIASVGVLVIAAAWLPAVLGFAGREFDAESLATIGFNVLLAGAAGTIAAVMFSQLRYGKPDIHLTYAGLLGGLVAVTAIADAPHAWMAALTGAVAGVIVPVLMLVLDLTWRLDDPTGGVAIHGGGAAWGLIAAGLFAPVETFSARFKLLGAQLVGIAAVISLALVLTLIVFIVLRKTVGLRSREADEFDGLDLAEHDIGAYPDFQQTTIKSYHLREA